MPHDFKRFILDIQRNGTIADDYTSLKWKDLITQMKGKLNDLNGLHRAPSTHEQLRFTSWVQAVPDVSVKRSFATIALIFLHKFLTMRIK